MPKVGKTEFPYTKAGMQEAKAWAEMTGKPLKSYQFGGGMHNPPRNLAAMGRAGDNMIRPVAGRPSHVNPVEAGMIDRFGKAGQQFAQRTGSGTVNPRTGLPEYSWFSKRVLKKGEKGGAEDWWNKNVKPIGKKNVWEGFGDILGLVDPTNWSSALTCIGTRGESHDSCMNRRANMGLSSIPWSDALAALWASEGKIGQHGEVYIPNQPHTGVDVTDFGADNQGGVTDSQDLTDEEREAILEAYGDSTAFVDDPPPPPPPPVDPPPAPRSLNLWGFSPFKKSSGGDWLDVMDKLLKGDIEKKEQGGMIEGAKNTSTQRFTGGYPKWMTDEKEVLRSINNFNPKDNGQVKHVQHLLKFKGYYKGKKDGMYGPATAKAIQDFNHDWNMHTKVPYRGKVDTVYSRDMTPSHILWGKDKKGGGGMIAGTHMAKPFYKNGGKLPKGWHM